MEKPLVSIIVPLYNKKKHLEEIFETISNQTYSNLEVIIIDDGSTDGSSEIINQFLGSEKSIRYFYQENQGVSSARNKGISVAKGDYISFLDADDKYDNNFIEKMIEKIGSYNVCYTGHYFVKDKKLTKAKINFTQGDILLNYFNGSTTPHMNSWMIKKSFIIQNQLWFNEELNWGEDMFFFSQVLTLEKNVQCCPEYLTYYSVGVLNSLSSNHLDKLEKDFNWTRILKDYLNSNLEGNRRRVLGIIDEYFIPALLTYRIFINRHNCTAEEIKTLYTKYEKYIEKEKLINGLKSCKLRACKLILKYKYINR